MLLLPVQFQAELALSAARRCESLLQEQLRGWHQVTLAGQQHAAAAPTALHSQAHLLLLLLLLWLHLQLLTLYVDCLFYLCELEWAPPLLGSLEQQPAQHASHTCQQQAYGQTWSNSVM
jgi:hypothetical protein